jgi:hypothetical protein
MTTSAEAMVVRALTSHGERLQDVASEFGVSLTMIGHGRR